jgi:hypothetical protein
VSPEAQLSPSILERAVWSGKEIGWRSADVTAALNDARDRQLAALGGQVQFILPDGTCELYWQNYESAAQEAGERWLDYVSRSHDEVAMALSHLPEPAALAADGLAKFEFLREKAAAGLVIEDFLIYVCDFASEDG